MQEKRIIKATPRCVIAAYDVSQSDDLSKVVKNTEFYISNDRPDSKTAIFVVHFMYIPNGHPLISIMAVPRESGDEVGYGFSLLDGSADSNLGMELSRLLDRDTSDEKAYILGFSDQKICAVRGAENPYDNFVKQRTSPTNVNGIGPQFRKDLLRILSVINVAVDKRGGQVDASQLNHIGDDPPSLQVAK